MKEKFLNSMLKQMFADSYNKKITDWNLTTKDLIQNTLLLDTMAQKSISNYQQPADSVSLTKIDGQNFEIVKVEHSSYNEDKGYKLTMKISYEIDGKQEKKFHTTRKVIVEFLDRPEVQEDLEKGNTLGPLKCELTKSKTGGKDYWILVDAV